MAKVKVVNTNLDQNLNGTNFTNLTSETIFQFGSFAVTSNFSGRIPIDYSNVLSTFVRPVTLETMGISSGVSEIFFNKTTNAVLNLDKSNLNTFIRYGSAYEFLRVCVQNIILAYPAGLHVSSSIYPSGNITFFNFTYDSINNISKFQVPSEFIVNKFGLVFNQGNQSLPNDEELRNLNLSYNKYVIWSKYDPNNYYPIIGFTGDTPGVNYVTVSSYGNPFTFNSGSTGYADFHIRPDNYRFEEFRIALLPYEQYIMSARNGLQGFEFTISDPTLLDDGSITYANTTILWPTTDDYNIDIDNSSYQRFLEILLAIGAKYDAIKTDLIARFLTPASIKTYDLTQDGKMTKLLRIFGREFDQVREFIDSLAYINTVTYNKINNIPDQLVANMARTFGWDYFNLVNETELVNSFLTIEDAERNLNTDLLPAEINIELWRRILINTNYFWKSKGTREAIKSMFLLIGIPEPFINITEYVYTVDGKINPNTVQLTAADFPSNSLPYDKYGYPQAPVETPEFYFQVSGDTDSGQAYMNAFRKAGFNLLLTVDNRKSWVQTGATTRVDTNTPRYYQADSKLVLNTKEVDVALDTARGIEYDVYNYIQEDYKINSSGYTMPFSYVNISLGITGTSQQTFKLPAPYDKTQGDLEVRVNGILLNAPRTYVGPTLVDADYSVDPVNNTFTLLTGTAGTKDVIQATFIYSGQTAHAVTGITVQYVVTRIKPKPNSAIIPLPSYPRGDVQLTINGIALTKGTPQFIADYILDPNNSPSGSSNIIIQNPEVISYLSISPYIQIAFVEVVGSNDINLRSEVVRIDSFNSGKVYYNSTANKYVYRLNYKANSATDLKFLVDGIALLPNKDYTLNVLDPYEVFLPSGLRYGTVISVYYLVGGNTVFTPVVEDVFGLGDISKLSFLEFIDLLQKKLINARNRKIVTDFKGGWYPALLRIYELYLKRSLLPENNPNHSNGYTFANLYPFLSKYNAFFQKFVDQLLSATIILKGSGLLIRNTVFTKQKFTYKRGVNLFSGSSTTVDMRGNPIVQYLGDDGSMFMIGQCQNTPPPPKVLSVQTICGTAGTSGSTYLGYINSGGMSITGNTGVTDYGMEFKKNDSSSWCSYPSPLIHCNLSSSSYNIQIQDLQEGCCYDYRAVVMSDSLCAVGTCMSISIPTTPIPPLPTPSGKTHAYSSISYSGMCNAGGCAIQGYDRVDWYGMQYRALGPNGICVTPHVYSNVSASGAVCSVCICGLPSNPYTASTAVSWLHPAPAVTPNLSGVSTTIVVDANPGPLARVAYVCYTPMYGCMELVSIIQANPLPAAKAVQMSYCGGYPQYYPDATSCLCVENAGAVEILGGATAGQYYYGTFNWHLSKPQTGSYPHKLCATITCNGTTIFTCSFSSKNACTCTGIFGPRCIDYNDVVSVFVYAEGLCSSVSSAAASVSLISVTNGSGCFCLGSQLSVVAQTIGCTAPGPEV